VPWTRKDVVLLCSEAEMSSRASPPDLLRLSPTVWFHAVLKSNAKGLWVCRDVCLWR